MTDDQVRDVIIIGSGPAGLTAALYSARAELKPFVIEGAAAGGQLMLTTEVDNFPGFPSGIMGPNLMDNMRKQAERFGADFLTDDVTEVDLAGDVKRVVVSGDEYAARTVIISTGARARWLGLPHEQALIGRGVSSCATCDGFFFREQDIVVVGGGDSAMEEATFLTRFARTVTIVHRRDTLRASKIMQNRARSNDKIRWALNSAVTDVFGESRVEGVQLTDTVTGAQTRLDVSGLFIAIGHDPNTTLFKGQVALDDEGYVLVDAPSTRTDVPGVFACGDCVDHTYRQAITAAGTGCAASLDAERFLAALG
ncbi:MAG TPA: thioredoxin-disulfide reductase [Mycobacteriales bacterium]|nr:thioredoxin-disulfide reductase [Mycobacteriales bacterium]